MKEIVKVLLQEGIDEETIHEVLDVLESLSSVTYEKSKQASTDFDEKARTADAAKAKYGIDSEEAKKAEAEAGKAYDTYHRANQLFNKAVQMRDNKKLHPHDARTKGERGQKQADYKKADSLKDGEQYLTIKGLRQYHDKNNGYNVAINKAIHRHDKKSK